MLAKCIKNQQKDIPEAIRKYSFNQDSQGILPLTGGKKYVVSAIKTQLGIDFYLILDNNSELKGQFWWYPSSLFQIVDNSQPDDWQTLETGNFKIVGFKELVDDPEDTFYNALEDGEEYAVKEFLEHYEKYALSHKLWYTDGKPAFDGIT